MALAAVSADRRFTRQRPCPICKGYESLPHSKGVRCAGFISEDGEYAHCQREEKAGPLRLSGATPPTYAHRLHGPCGCGVTHGMAHPTPITAKAQASAGSDLGRAIAEYPYYDASGTLLYKVVRYEPKSFRPWHYEQGRWIAGLGNAPRVLYRLPDILTSELNDATIYVVEGEKDVETLRKHGLVATTNQGGAGQWKHTPSALDVLRGRHVVVIPDNDPEIDQHGHEHRKGQKHADEVAESLKDIAASVKIALLPTELGKDVSDFFAHGGTAAKLVAIGDAASAWGETPLRYRFLSDEEQDHRPKPTFLIGGILIDRGINILFGDSQAGKTFLGLDLSLCVATDREWHNHHTEHGTVAYIAGEDPDGVIMRKHVWKKHFGYERLKNFFVLDENVPLMQDPHVDSLIQSLKTLPGELRLIVIDTLSCAMVGNDSDKTKDAVQFMEVIKRIRTECNCAILLIHHKNKQGQELGNVSFRNGADVMLDLERDGDMITLKSEKTKNAPRFDPIYMTLAVVGDSCVLWPRVGEVDEYGRLSDKYAMVLEALKEHFPLGASTVDWRKAADIPEATFFRALKALKHAGYVNQVPGDHGKEKYMISPIGRAYYHDSHMTLSK